MGNFSKDFKTVENEVFCFINYNNKEFIGKAECHPDDQDFFSESTGKVIAERRALIKYGKYVLAAEVRPQLKILRHLQASMKQSKSYNARSNEARLLRRQVAQLEKEEQMIKLDIACLFDSINDFIDAKDDFYKRIRAKRAEDKKD